MTTITDQNIVTLEMTGDVNEEYVWINNHGDFLGSGRKIRTCFKRYGLNSVKCIVVSGERKGNIIELEDEYFVEIDYVNRFVKRVNAEIAISGGTLLQSHIDAMSNFVSTILRLCNGERIMSKCLWWPVLPVSPEVCALDFNEYRNYANQSYGYTLHNSPIIQNGFLYFNGVDQCAYTSASSLNTNTDYGGFMLSYVGENTELNQEWTFARNNNGNRFQMECHSDGKDIRPSTRSSGNVGHSFGKGNAFYTTSPIENNRRCSTMFFCGESNSIPSSTWTETTSRRLQWGGSNIRHQVGLGQGFSTSADIGSMSTFTELEYGGIFLSNEECELHEIEIINAAWEKYHSDLGRAITY